jgi:VIT1/CCC1 family predicted Fe2+/Mn2+ transporter
VQSQADTELADLAVEKRELHEDPHSELEELAAIYRHRGLSPDLAHEVATQLTAHDALGAHARDELGITEELRARPMQAAMASAGAFVSGAALPVLTALLAPHAVVGQATTVVTLLGLCLTGTLAAHAGGAPRLRGAVRVTFWGAIAMAAAALVGRLFNVAG